MEKQDINRRIKKQSNRPDLHFPRNLPDHLPCSWDVSWVSGDSHPETGLKRKKFHLHISSHFKRIKPELFTNIVPWVNLAEDNNFSRREWEELVT